MNHAYFWRSLSDVQFELIEKLSNADQLKLERIKSLYKWILGLKLSANVQIDDEFYEFKGTNGSSRFLNIEVNGKFSSFGKHNGVAIPLQDVFGNQIDEYSLYIIDNADSIMIDIEMYLPVLIQQLHTKFEYTPSRNYTFNMPRFHDVMSNLIFPKFNEYHCVNEHIGGFPLTPKRYLSSVIDLGIIEKAFFFVYVDVTLGEPLIFHHVLDILDQGDCLPINN